ncbi:MAG TPA: hypothetical protein VLU99_04930 [Nitrososphaerales archaeon]|nr:hypothetical protein [Nitrososphaerales archaeon]
MGQIANTFGGSLVWSSASQFEVTEGILIIAATMLLALGVEYRGSRSPLSHPIFRRHVRYPMSLVFVILAGVGALCFDDLVLCNFKELNSVIDLNGWNLAQYPLSVFGHLGGSAMGEGGRLGYGALAVSIWGLTLVALSLGAGFRTAVKLFALPSMLFLSVVVFLFDPREMASQAVNLVSGATFQGVSILSNWSLLTVSLFFTAREVAQDVLARGSSPNAGLGTLLASMRAPEVQHNGRKAPHHRRLRPVEDGLGPQPA